MNERILELAERAGFENGHQDHDGRSLSNELTEFTKLIVQECIDQVEVFNVRMDARPRHIVEAIRQHFGVKE